MATPPVHPRASTRTFATVTVSTAATGLSDSVDISGLTLSCISMSTGWDAAVLGFQATVNGTTNYQNLYDKDGNLYYFQVAASRLIVVDPAIFSGIQNLRLISETTGGSVVTQSASRVITLGLCKTVD